MEWLEIAPDFRCNLRCVGCLPSPPADPPQANLPSEEIVAHLRRARAHGATGLWFGGGEPTLRADLPRLVAIARRLGFTEVKLQTNGLRLAYPPVTEALVRAGVTSVNLALRSADPDIHDRLVRRAGAHHTLSRALEVLRATRLVLEGDVLISRSNAAGLPETIRAYAAQDIRAFNLWLICRLLPDDAATAAELIPYREAVPPIVDALRLAPALGVTRITSLHTPACVMPTDLRGHLYYPPDLALRIVNADGRSFWLEESPMEGGAPLPSCARCSWRPRCLGPRADYLEAFGPDEFVPIA